MQADARPLIFVVCHSALLHLFWQELERCLECRLVRHEPTWDDTLLSIKPDAIVIGVESEQFGLLHEGAYALLRRAFDTTPVIWVTNDGSVPDRLLDSSSTFFDVAAPHNEATPHSSRLKDLARHVHAQLQQAAKLRLAPHT